MVPTDVPRLWPVSFLSLLFFKAGGVSLSHQFVPVHVYLFFFFLFLTAVYWTEESHTHVSSFLHLSMKKRRRVKEMRVTPAGV